MKEGAAAGEGGIGEKAGAGAAAKLVKLPKLAKVHFNFSFSFSQFGTNAADIQLIETERLRGKERGRNMRNRMWTGRCNWHASNVKYVCVRVPCCKTATFRYKSASCHFVVHPDVPPHRIIHIKSIKLTYKAGWAGQGMRSGQRGG